MFERVIILVLDSVGVGAMPDAEEFGDAGSDTLGHVAEFRPLLVPNLARWGIGNIRPLEGVLPVSVPLAAHGKMGLASRGKDTTSGHWEMMGLVLEQPFRTYPDGFPAEVIEPFEEAIGRKCLGNVPASGTEIIARLGDEHLRTGKPIVYTSADSVFQVAAHENVIPVDELYRICRIARELLDGEHRVGRVIARPFTGSPGEFVRDSARRKDYAVPPFTPTVLDHLQAAGVPVIAIGKIASIYCNRGVDEERKTGSNPETAAATLSAMEDLAAGLIFANFVDFDMLYGHRNNPEGYAAALEEFDRDLARVESKLRRDDLIILVSDHGCDPTTASTDHSREYALLLAHSPSQSRPGENLGTRDSLADVGATVAENFEVESPAGSSFLTRII